MTGLLQWQRGGFLALAAGLLGVAMAGTAVPAAWQVYSLVVLVILAGLPHGALDPLVARKAEIWRTSAGFIAFIAGYLALAGLSLLGWLALPGPALLGFLLYSGYHFSGDWRGDLSFSLRVPSGLFLVSAPALLHPEQTSTYFSLLAGENPTIWIIPTMQGIAIPAAAGIVGAVLQARDNPWLRLELLVLIAAAVLLEPLLFFILYFCTVHSPRHLIHAAQGLPPRAVAATAVTFTLLSVLLGAAALIITGTAPLADGLIQVLFVGLAVLTVPHMLLVEWKEVRPKGVV